MRVCFWCGKPDGLALLGRLPNDAESPREAVFDYDRCPTCAEQWAKGIAFIEATEGADPRWPDRPPLPDTRAVPTGRFAVVTEDGAEYLVADKALLEAMMRRRMTLIEPAAFERAILPLVAEGGESAPA